MIAMKLFVVKYTGPFGYIKPWTAVRDGETFSQQFLTPSIIEGMEKKLFPETVSQPGLHGLILGHRLNYTGISRQQEQTWSKAWTMVKNGEPVVVEKEVVKKGKTTLKKEKLTPYSYRPTTAILNRGVLIDPQLYLAFSSQELAERATKQHLCLCRNEDVIFPEGGVIIATETEWNSDTFPGFELVEAIAGKPAFHVGYNRFNNAAPMYGTVVSYGDPIRKIHTWQ